MSTQYRISVVIPAYNEEGYISRCLQTLSEQKVNERFEVIFVDNVSTDKTASVARSFENKLNLKIITEQEKGRGAARATGFEAATGEIIFSTDADISVPPDWMEKHLQFYEKGAADAVTGICLFENTTLPVRIFNNILPAFPHLFRLVFGCYVLSGFNFSIKKSTYIKSGGFDRKLNAQEDTDLSFKVQKIGNVKYTRNSIVFSSSRRFEEGLLKGLSAYISSFNDYRFRRKDSVDLSDMR